MITIDFFITVFIIIVILIYFRNKNKLEKSDKEIKKEKLYNYMAIISVIVLIMVFIAFTNRGTQSWPFSRNDKIEEEGNALVPEFQYNLQEEQAVVMLVNQERTREGLDVLAHDPGLRELARFQAVDLLELDYYDHILPGYSSSLEMVKNAGLVQYNKVGVNFVKSSGNAGDALESMSRSSHQWKNIMEEDYTNLGVGVVEVSDRGPETFRLYIIIFAGT